LRRIAVGTEPAIARIILDQERHAGAGDHCEHAEDKIGLAPANIRDQKRRQGRHDQRTEADAARSNAGGQTTAPREPAWHRADRRNIGASNAEANAEPVGGIDLEQALRHAGGDEACPDQNHADQGEPARAEAVGERSADAADAKIEEAGQREDKRHRAARGAEIALQGFDEGAERISAAEAHEGDGKSRSDYEPAVEEFSIVAKHWNFRNRGIVDHDRLLRFPAKIGGRAALGHPIYFGHERSIDGSNGALPDIDLVFAEAGLVLPKAKASVPASGSYAS
jgi:hypothetical protein